MRSAASVRHPRDYNPLIDTIDATTNLGYLQRIKSEIRDLAGRLPTHQSLLPRESNSGRPIIGVQKSRSLVRRVRV